MCRCVSVCVCVCQRELCRRQGGVWAKGGGKSHWRAQEERDRRDCKAADAGQWPQSAWGSGGKDAVEDWRSWSQWNQKAQREWKDWKGGWREWSGAGDKDPNRHTHVLATSCIVQYASQQIQICLKEEWSKKQRQGRQKRCSRGLARLLLTDVDNGSLRGQGRGSPAGGLDGV